MKGNVLSVKGVFFAALLVFAFPVFGGHEAVSVENPTAPVEAQAPAQPAASDPRTIDNRSQVWVASPLSGPVRGHPVANFGVVEEGILYRSAQPSQTDYQWLLDNGVKSIVSFRKEKGDTRNEVIGLGFQNYLFLDIEDETNPSDTQAEKFLTFVTDSRNWPVLIHCKVGVGRTGTLAALVRYAVDGWTMDEALKEARLYRNGIELVPSQTAWLSSWASRHPRGSHHPAWISAPTSN